MKSYPHIDIAGNKFWRNEAELRHRDEDDLPAVEYSDGTKIWWKNGIRHRDNGLPVVEDIYGNKSWWINGVCYRRDEWINFYL